MRIEARGLTFDVHAAGPEDGEAVLLLHGFPQHSGEWDRITPGLNAAGLRTYALDQRGYSPGARPADVEAYRLSECVTDAVAVLDALGVPAAHLVGHDWGALVGWQLAARHPDRVRTFTAVSVPHPAAMAYALHHDPKQKIRSAYVRLFQQPGKAEKVLLALDGAALRKMLSGAGDADRVARYVEPMREPGALTAALNWYRAMPWQEMAAEPRVSVPTTFVWSDGDSAVGRTAAEACEAQVSGDYRFVALSGVTHWIPDQAPEPLVQAVLARTGRA